MIHDKEIFSIKHLVFLTLGGALGSCNSARKVFGEILYALIDFRAKMKP